MLEHCINATTFEDDIILDCFGGSGSTSIASLNLNRYSISIELEKEWYDSIVNRLTDYKQDQKLLNGSRQDFMKSTGKKTQEQPTLFTYNTIPSAIFLSVTDFIHFKVSIIPESLHTTLQ